MSKNESLDLQEDGHKNYGTRKSKKNVLWLDLLENQTGRRRRWPGHDDDFIILNWSSEVARPPPRTSYQDGTGMAILLQSEKSGSETSLVSTAEGRIGIRARCKPLSPRKLGLGEAALRHPQRLRRSS